MVIEAAFFSSDLLVASLAGLNEVFLGIFFSRKWGQGKGTERRGGVGAWVLRRERGGGETGAELRRAGTGHSSRDVRVLQGMEVKGDTKDLVKA